MKRSLLAVVAAIVLVPAWSGVAIGAAPATPDISSVTARWGMYAWDDGTELCTLIADAVLDPAYTRGRPVVAQAYVHVMYVGPGGGTWMDFNFSTDRLERGAAEVHAYTGFWADTGYYVADEVRFELRSTRGVLIASRTIPTANTCLNG